MSNSGVRTLGGHHGLALHMFAMFFAGAALWVSSIEWRTKGGLAIGAIAAIIVAATINRDAFFVVYALTLPFVVIALAYSRQPKLLAFNRLGDYSYGIYIYAFPVQQWCASLWEGIDAVRMIVVSLAMTLVFAVGSWHLVERRALAYKPSPLIAGQRE